eukprot:5310030-Ditylum_brightwellii.AAC.1
MMLIFNIRQIADVWKTWRSFQSVCLRAHVSHPHKSRFTGIAMYNMHFTQSIMVGLQKTFGIIACKALQACRTQFSKSRQSLKSQLSMEPRYLNCRVKVMQSFET